MAKKHILLVDGNSIAHANHNGTKLTVGGMQVQAIFGVLKSLLSMMQKFSGQKEIIVLWDGRAQFRLDLYPEYKGNRAPKSPADEAHNEARKRQMPYLEKALSLLGVRQLRSPLLEADDLAGFLIPSFVAQGHQVTMITGDMDWLQEVGPSVSWYDPIRDRSCDHETFLDFTGYFNPRAFVQGKALQGDSSDNIKGVGGIGKDGAPVFLAQWKSVEAFFQAVDNGTAGKLGKKHTEFATPEGRAKFELNMKLMDWKQSRRPAPGEIITYPSVVNVALFEHFCNRLAFQSILREFTMFLKAFNITYTKETT